MAVGSGVKTGSPSAGKDVDSYFGEKGRLREEA